MQPWMTELVSHKAASAPRPSTPTLPSARRPAPRHAAVPAPYIPAELQRFVVTSLDHLLTDVAKARIEGRLHATIYVSEAGWQRFGKEIKSMMGADGFGPSSLVRFGLVPLGPKFAERAAELSASGCLVKPGDIDRADVAARLGIDVALATFAYGTHGSVSSYMPYCPALVVRGTCHAASGSRHAGHVAEIAEPSPPWSMRQDLDDHVRRHRTSLAAAKANVAEAASLKQASSAKAASGDVVVKVALRGGAAASATAFKGAKQVSYELA
ncbi:hypothetical protein HYH03_011766 [Edaphochlamys debaryana]|uniref:Uncharacterized protein n=1 Tax=Edaphochlamys debaryana TaxID=47281 RepID=A0A835XUB2_9CHLO|nr:hypothetical protein HYH03_011766 [Edaphochlamys debaryana]|eukprot:KAG2489817.1 hypothetical protein HYH03_011766 [Edaphochlamys debaryana]